MIDLYRILGDYSILASSDDKSGFIQETLGDITRITHFNNIQDYERNLKKERI